MTISRLRLPRAHTNCHYEEEHGSDVVISTLSFRALAMTIDNQLFNVVVVAELQLVELIVSLAL